MKRPKPQQLKYAPDTFKGAPVPYPKPIPERRCKKCRIRLLLWEKTFCHGCEPFTEQDQGGMT